MKIFSGTLLAACMMALPTMAAGWEYDVRLGYHIGGTAPLGMPASIRKVNSFSLMPNVQLGADAKHFWNSRWGAMVGLRLENKAMKEDVQVKNYHMEMVQGSQSLEGMFTGNVQTRVIEWMVTMPVQAVMRVGKVDIKAGPYVSWLFNKTFDGYAHDGYLRVGNPTGAKVEIGDSEDTRGEYDFSSQMRNMQLGVSVGADWNIGKVGVYADLNWGLTGIHKSNFKTIEQTLYPIYGTIGIQYNL